EGGLGHIRLIAWPRVRIRGRQLEGRGKAGRSQRIGRHDERAVRVRVGGRRSGGGRPGGARPGGGRRSGHWTWGGLAARILAACRYQGDYRQSGGRGDRIPATSRRLRSRARLGDRTSRGGSAPTEAPMGRREHKEFLSEQHA